MKLENSKNLNCFKKEVGQSNHFLITLLIGLDGVMEGKVTKKDEFNVLWNPKDVNTSVLRSREYAIKSAMAWIIDNFDMYMRQCNSKPKLISSASLINAFEKNGRSIYANFNSLSNYFNLNTRERAFVDLFICWRNRLIHFKADNQLPKPMREILLENAECLKEDFSGLNIYKTLERFDNSVSPSFKDIASLTKALIDFVYDVDRILIADLNLEYYIKCIVEEYFKDKTKVRLHRVYGKGDMEKRRRILNNLLTCYSFSQEENDEIDGIVNDIINMTQSEVYRKLTSDSFV